MSEIQKFKENRKILKARIGAKPLAPVEETIGDWVREKNRSLFGSGMRWYNRNSPIGRQAIAMEKETIVKDANGKEWILKPNGTKVSVAARQANTQVTRNNATRQAIKTESEVVQDVPQQPQTLKQTTEQTPKQISKQITRRRVSSRINRPDYAKNFANFQFSPEEIAYMKNLNYDPTDARSVQEFILSEIPDANLGVRKGVGKTDGLWGQQSIAAFQALRDKGVFKPKIVPIVEQPVLDAADPFGYRTSNHYGNGMELKNLGFNNYAGLQAYAKTSSDQFAKDLRKRFGEDVSAWDQAAVEGDLKVSGRYRGGRAGDFGDMARSMARWAGQTNATYDTRKEASIAKPIFNTREMLNNVKSLKFTAPEWKFSLNQGNIGATTLGNLPSTRPN